MIIDLSLLRITMNFDFVSFKDYPLILIFALLHSFQIAHVLC